MADSFQGLERFLSAQERVYADVLQELRSGHKQSHWMWFIFPQLQGLGRSEMAHYFGLVGRVEAEAYWQHPLLKARLEECTQLVLGVQGRSARSIFGTPDDLKFCSCMTLFSEVTRQLPEQERCVFDAALDKYFAGMPDARTLSML